MSLAKTLDMLIVDRAKSFGDKSIQRLSDGIFGRIKKHPFGCGIKENNSLSFINRNDRIHRRTDYACKLLLAASQFLFRLLALSYIDDRAQDHRSLFGVQRIQADFDRKLAAIFP